MAGPNSQKSSPWQHKKFVCQSSLNRSRIIS